MSNEISVISAVRHNPKRAHAQNNHPESDDQRADREENDCVARSKVKDQSGRVAAPLWEARASAVPAHAFASEILDVQAAPLKPRQLTHDPGRMMYPNPWIAIRTRTRLLLCSVIPSKSIDVQKRGFPLYSLRQITEFSSPCEQGRKVSWADIAFRREDKTQAALITETGHFASWSIDFPVQGRKWSSGMMIRSRESFDNGNSGHDSDASWRLCQGPTSYSILAHSSHTIYHQDLRTAEAKQLLYSAKVHPWIIAKERITSMTSIEDRYSSPLFFASTTGEVLCFDARKTSRPLLTWQHGRGPDTSLALSAVPDTTQILLSSSFSRLLVAYSGTGVAHSVAEPYQVASGLPIGSLQGALPVCIDWSSFEDDHWEERTGCSHALFQMSSTGAVVVSGLSRHNDDSNEARGAHLSALEPFPISLNGPGMALLAELERRVSNQADRERDFELVNHEAVWKAATTGQLVPDVAKGPRAIVEEAQETCALLREEQGLHANLHYLHLPHEALRLFTSPGQAVASGSHGFPITPFRALAASSAAHQAYDEVLQTLGDEAEQINLKGSLQDALGAGVFSSDNFGKGIEHTWASKILTWDLRLSSSAIKPDGFRAESLQRDQAQHGTYTLTDDCLVLRSNNEATQVIGSAPERPSFSTLEPLHQPGSWSLQLRNKNTRGSRSAFADRSELQGLGEVRLGNGAKLVLDDWQLGMPLSASVYAARLGRDDRLPSENSARASSVSTSAAASLRRSASSTGGTPVSGSSPPPTLGALQIPRPTFSSFQPPAIAASSQLASRAQRISQVQPQLQVHMRKQQHFEQKLQRPTNSPLSRRPAFPVEQPQRSVHPHASMSQPVQPSHRNESQPHAAAQREHPATQGAGTQQSSWPQRKKKRLGGF
ncbi:hypothetical protein K437DRAFT_267196 [Tilletiaria anomala UBC 951]|uniref:RNA polymerase I-specific transcription initiation factor RRN6-like protein n=1 Tax=Tilletiaria anomala (strain ATCC 24038 / CBS 436.72 / UBC 951) TaxID=1037660 RepID=A0A066WAQ4_TILAU|nr:uncharacterized protein K437DRAFT_267196 [Tilletiaria anomala UBC 951]KDN50806.1 hypothetical protein K437DRAFT_267196 [Tilletiaria anomala UBC 951]